MGNEMDDNTDEMIEETTKAILNERGLDRVEVRGVQHAQDKDRLSVQLVEKTAPKESKFHWLHVEPVEVLSANQAEGITAKTLKPFIQRELLRIFPE